MLCSWPCTGGRCKQLQPHATDATPQLSSTATSFKLLSALPLVSGIRTYNRSWHLPALTAQHSVLLLLSSDAPQFCPLSSQIWLAQPRAVRAALEHTACTSHSTPESPEPHAGWLAAGSRAGPHSQAHQAKAIDSLLAGPHAACCHVATSHAQPAGC